MSFLKKFGEWAQTVLLPLGGWGLFTAAVLDSSFLSLPNIVDLWVISLSVLNPSRMPFYVFAATTGSLIGCLALYFVTRKGEEILRRKNPNYSGLPRVRRWVEKYGALAIIIASVLPPPTPFKLFVIAAGLAKYPLERFVLALLVGRGARYFVEGWLGVRYGRQVWDWFISSGPAFAGAVALAIILILLTRRLQRKAPPAEN